jgi:phosphatidylglycerophosphate synthase
MERRPIKTRSRAWAHRVSGMLIRAGLTPNQVSLLGVVFGLGAGALLVWRAARPLWLIIAAGCIQLRLLCNMLDGLMAIEGEHKSPTGDLFNELPDRAEDAAILVGAGYAVQCPTLGWAAALAAVLTAYVRAFGGALGKPQDFCGPIAKPQRMFVVTLGCLGAAVEVLLDRQPALLRWALLLALAGTIITVGRRTLRLARALEAK